MISKSADEALTNLHWRIRRFCREYPLSVEMSDLIVQWTREAYLSGVANQVFAQIALYPSTVRPVEVHAVLDSIDVPQ